LMYLHQEATSSQANAATSWTGTATSALPGSVGALYDCSGILASSGGRSGVFAQITATVGQTVIVNNSVAGSAWVGSMALFTPSGTVLP